MSETQKLVAYLHSFLTEERQKKIKKNILTRTRYITVVLEDLYQSHNMAAVLRSCDALGVQDVHCIEQKHTLEIKKNISMGATKWLTMHRYTDTESTSALQTCVTQLKYDGYALIATSPHATKTIHELSLDKKIAFMFGTEDEGLSAKACAYADEIVTIPMFGFVESFNVSVSAALCLYDVVTRLRVSKYQWRLSEQEQELLELQWLKKAVTNGEIREREFYKLDSFE